MKVKICTLISIFLDLAAIGILAYIGTMSNSLLLWLCLALAAYGFIWDISNAIKFYKQFKKNN